MVDSELVVIGREVAAWCSQEPVVPAAGSEGEQALCDAGGKAWECAGAVALEGELALAGVHDRLDPLAHLADRSEAWLLVAAVGADEDGAETLDELLELLAREAFVTDDDLAGFERPLQQLGRDLALGCVGAGKLERRSASRRERRAGRDASPRSSGSGRRSSRRRRSLPAASA
jgi:hypothetical protein